MPGKTKPAQDASGHVSYDSAQTQFHRMVQRRAERIEVARQYGLLEHKPSRNPLRAEKTPRGKEYKCFNFSIPEGPADLKAWDRWDYPTIDFGLMGKFRSQKHVYENYMGKHSDYQSKMADFRSKGPASPDKEQAPAGLWNEATGPRDASYDAFESEHRQQQQQQQQQRQLPPKLPLPTQREPEPLGPFKISDFKMVAGINPEAIAKWRAKRAADFVTTQKHPLDPPTARELAERPFVVSTVKAGALPSSESPTKPKVVKLHPPPNKYATPAVVDTARLQQSLGSLMSELRRTQDDISRSELKLALKNKQKSY